MNDTEKVDPTCESYTFEVTDDNWITCRKFKHPKGEPYTLMPGEQLRIVEVNDD